MQRPSSAPTVIKTWPKCNAALHNRSPEISYKLEDEDGSPIGKTTRFPMGNRSGRSRATAVAALLAVVLVTTLALPWLRHFAEHSDHLRDFGLISPCDPEETIPFAETCATIATPTNGGALVCEHGNHTHPSGCSFDVDPLIKYERRYYISGLHVALFNASGAVYLCPYSQQSRPPRQARMVTRGRRAPHHAMQHR